MVTGLRFEEKGDDKERQNVPRSQRQEQMLEFFVIELLNF